jgi:hypothetical protein
MDTRDTTPSAAALSFDPVLGRQNFNQVPFGYSHNLHTLDLFTADSLRHLTEKLVATPRDYFVAAGAPSPGAEFYSVAHSMYPPDEALRQLDAKPCRILLKRPENHDPRFRALLNTLFEQIVALRGGLGNERIVRLESAVFISSTQTTTPFHFDPEIGFFSQIEGEKTYHVFQPRAVQEQALERFYKRGEINIGQLDLAGCDTACEQVFALQPGCGLHQPLNAPHWVTTGAARAVSYTIVFETNATRILGRAHAFNHYARRLGLAPAVPGANPTLDVVKAGTMRIAIPARNRLSRMIHRT